MADPQDDSITTVDLTDHLPLPLFRSDTIPPAPNRTKSGSSVDFLPDFAGYSWVAYGASTLLVISHFPSPLSPEETLIGPIFRQSFELSGDESSAVTAVSWSPARPSNGEVAAAAENCVCLFSHDSVNSQGSFCWSQSAILVQSTKVEAIKWTGSGDGIIACGMEVVLWKNRSRSWEIAWKFKTELPQTLVSATWSIEGHSATAAYPSEGSSASKCVSVCYADGKLEYAKNELRHPQPVSMIQWRPLSGTQSNRGAKHSQRQMLLTCCLDGTVRLWSEVEIGRGKKNGKDSNDHKKPSFFVSAVIEINQALKGILGEDVFVTWATEIGGIFKIGGGGNKIFSSEEGFEHDRTGRCEWLIGFGPGMLVTFWSIHCLDDTTPMRFPRITLWKKQELQGLEIEHLHGAGFSKFENGLLLNKVVILRNHSSGPPSVCSLIHLLPCNSLIWSLLYTQTSNNIENASLNTLRTDNFLSYSAGGVFDTDGHTGKILQVAVHPCSHEVELAVSFDSNGLLLFWTLSTISNCVLGLPSLIPTWKLRGKFGTQGSCSKYTSLRWAPSVLFEDYILLMGHAGGIDCFVVKISLSEEEHVVCHNLCTIPFTSHVPLEDGPTNIFTTPLPSTCNETFTYHKFMLLGVWMKGFQALSWEITLHSYDLLGTCCKCNFDTKDPECCMERFESTFSGKRYCLGVDLCTSQLPQPSTVDQVTSFAVVCPDRLIPSIQQKLASASKVNSNHPAYIMATGCSDGSLKLWRSNRDIMSTPHSPWQLVGMFVAHQGPISAVCLTDCGRKIATICLESHSNSKTTSMLCIWDSVHLTGGGVFMLEDTLSLDGEAIALSWLALGNGQFLLGVCMQNELRIYAQKRCGGLNLLNTEKSLKIQVWFCIAFVHTSPQIHDFLWGPRATAVIVHDSYFCLFSQWLFLVHKKQSKYQPNSDSNTSRDNPRDSEDGADKGILCAVFSDCKSKPHVKINMNSNHISSSLFVAETRLRCTPGTNLGFWNMLEVVEHLCGSLPVYHPEALLINVYSGNWKRAYAAVQHLVEYITSNIASEKRHFSEKSSNIVPQILLSNYFEGLLLKSSTDKEFQWSGDATSIGSSSQFGYNSSSDASNKIFMSSSSTSEVSSFVEPLEKLSELAAMTNKEKMQILTIVDILGEISNPHSSSAYASLDVPGRRYWVSLRFQQLYHFRRFGHLASVEELVADSWLIGWAFHSDCQEILFSSVLPNDPSWQQMQSLGVGFWFTNATHLRGRMEKLARLQYLKRKDPKDCALLYIALNRLQVLASLFKISKDERDKPLVGFLLRNFQEEKNKAAALKNAYVLMGRHQLELAIAFFLLGGDTSSAITVCAKNLGDEQLALVICRLVDGHGGPLERYLISKFILPSAVEKGDYWLASLLEWELGNYSQSFLTMLGFQTNSVINKSTMTSSRVAFFDPSIGQFCLTLVAKNSMRNAVGEQNAAILCRWATLMTATALNRCGLPLEALECLSSSASIVGGINQGNGTDNGYPEILFGILKSSSGDSSNWLSGDVAFHLESNAKLDLALEYFSKLMREHPSWPDTIIGSSGASKWFEEYENRQYVMLLENFRHKLYTGLAQFEQKFSLLPVCIANMILVSLSNRGLLSIGYDMFHGYTSQDHLQDESLTVDSSILYPLRHKLLIKVTKEISLLFSRFIAACNITCSQPKLCYMENHIPGEVRSRWLDVHGYEIKGLVLLLWSLRDSLRIFSGSYIEDLTMKPLAILDLVEYYVLFAFSWLQRNSKGLILMVQPLLITLTNGHTPYDVDMENLKKLLQQLIAQNLLIDDADRVYEVAKCMQDERDRVETHPILEDEKWKILGACLWQHLSNFMEHKLNMVFDKVEDTHFSGVSLGRPSSGASSFTYFGTDNNSITEQIRLVSLISANLLKTTLAHVSSYHVKQLALSLRQKVEGGVHVPVLVWLEESCQSKPKALRQHLNQGALTLDMIKNKDEMSVSETLWEMCADPKIITGCFAKEKIDWSHYFKPKPSKEWSDIYEGIAEEHTIVEPHNDEGRDISSSASGETESTTRGMFQNGRTFLSSWQKDTTLVKEVTPFQKPKEIYKRNGELLEALCINSIDQQQAALASNRKGIIFFNWDNGTSLRDQSDNFWADADWPQNGWAGSESTPVPTCVSPGVGLGSKKGAHLGLGGATIGVGSLARPARDLTGSGAFGVPSYAGVGASGLGWEIQDDFEEFADPPATVENISTRAFSSHPSRPLFLVGSSNTHIYLWEFGEDRATATYGVLPAANVPPPYALASISALQFDHYGQRFATAALDGTVCIWQLEVGGRSNIRPTESSLCFNSHASDVSYVTSSGSIIAAAGHSSNGVNVVIWDTLAPPATSRASIICHQGGARSLSVFDNDIGSGSVSPLIVTGGKGGDVGLHDFRYIATGRTKRHRHSDNGEQSINTSSITDLQTGTANNFGDQNQNGMLWYIPKAHLGSVTKISTIPNTSLFLTGSKDGDVKLWDAKRAKLVYHWSKLHERHTYLQPSSRGFGGVVRAAVTDIQVLSRGFLTCGGDGSVKVVQLKGYEYGT